MLMECIRTFEYQNADNEINKNEITSFLANALLISLLLIAALSGTLWTSLHKFNLST